MPEISGWPGAWRLCRRAGGWRGYPAARTRYSQPACSWPSDQTSARLATVSSSTPHRAQRPRRHRGQLGPAGPVEQHRGHDRGGQVRARRRRCRAAASGRPARRRARPPAPAPSSRVLIRPPVSVKRGCPGSRTATRVVERPQRHVERGELVGGGGVACARPRRRPARAAMISVWIGYSMCRRPGAVPAPRRRARPGRSCWRRSPRTPSRSTSSRRRGPPGHGRWRAPRPCPTGRPPRARGTRGPPG